MERAHTALAGDAVQRLSSQIHETPTATERGLECAVPVSITGLAMVASSERAAGELLRALQGGDYPHVAAEELSPVVSDPGATNRLVQSGEGLLGRIFGSKLDSIVDALAGQTGVTRESAIKLLGLSAPLVLDVVGKQAQSERLDANGLSRFLDDQSRAASGNLPGPVSTALADARQGVPRQRAEEAKAETQEWRPGERRAMTEQARTRAAGVLGRAKQRAEGAIADVRDRVGDVRDDVRHRARGADFDAGSGHVSAKGAARHERQPSRRVMWLLVAIVLIGAVAVLVARARRKDAETPIPERNVQGLEAPRVPLVTAPMVPPPRREAVPKAAEESPTAGTTDPETQTAPPEGMLGEEQGQPAIHQQPAQQ